MKVYLKAVDQKIVYIKLNNLHVVNQNGYLIKAETLLIFTTWNCGNAIRFNFILELQKKWIEVVDA